MTKLTSIMASGFALCAAVAQTAFAGVSGGYSVDPVVEDGGSDAGLVLLLAVGTLLVIRAIATPKPTPEADPGTSDTAE